MKRTSLKRLPSRILSPSMAMLYAAVASRPTRAALPGRQVGVMMRCNMFILLYPYKINKLSKEVSISISHGATSHGACLMETSFEHCHTQPLPRVLPPALPENLPRHYSSSADLVEAASLCRNYGPGARSLCRMRYNSIRP